MKCPKCGKPRKEEDQECPFCGVHFLLFDRKLKGEDNEASDKTVAVFEGPQVDEKLQTACPKCGQQYTIRKEQLGLKTRCKKCQTPFETAPLASSTDS